VLGYITSQWDRCLVPQNVFLVFVIFLPYFLLLLTRTKVLLSFSLVCVYTFLRNFVRQILSLSLSVAKPVPFCRKSTASSFLPQSLPVSATFFSTTFFCRKSAAKCSFLLRSMLLFVAASIPQISSFSTANLPKICSFLSHSLPLLYYVVSHFSPFYRKSAANLPLPAAQYASYCCSKFTASFFFYCKNLLQSYYFLPQICKYVYKLLAERDRLWGRVRFFSSLV